MDGRTQTQDTTMTGTETGMTTTETITDNQIEALRREAEEADDTEQVFICSLALGAETVPELTDEQALSVSHTLGGDVARRLRPGVPLDAARAECARVIADAEAQAQD